MMEGFARANRSRSGATGEPSAGVVPALRALLAARPTLGTSIPVLPDSINVIGTDGTPDRSVLIHTRSGPEAAPRQQHPIHGPATANDGATCDALYKRLAQDEGACYLIEESLHGARTVRCSARMAEMFISTEELQGLVDQTGLAVGHLMMRCVWRMYVCMYVCIPDH